MDGLIIKKYWLDKIFDEIKWMEIRSSDTNKRGEIALIESGSGNVVGSARLEGTMRFKDDIHFIKCKEAHYVQGCRPYKETWAWRLFCSARYKKPIPYKHPQGAVIWVKDVL